MSSDSKKPVMKPWVEPEIQTLDVEDTQNRFRLGRDGGNIPYYADTVRS